jgi:uncharacterized membrane protein
MQGNSLALAWPRAQVTPGLGPAVNDTFILGAQRTAVQDIEFAIEQLVEVALRALSPGINDPFTAINCIDRLGAAVCELCDRALPSPARYDESGRLRVLARSVSFRGVVDTAFNQIRQSAWANVSVTIRLLETLAVIAARTVNETQRAALQRQAEMIVRGSLEAIVEEQDRADVMRRLDAVLRALCEERFVPPLCGRDAS